MGWVTPIPILVIPPMIMLALRKMISARALLLPLEVATVAGCMYFALPFTLAIQPQTMTLKPENLEAQFQGLKDKRGKPITEIFANKGL